MSIVIGIDQGEPRRRLQVASFKNRDDVQELTILSAFAPKSSADWPIIVTPPKFLRTVLMDARALSSNWRFLSKRRSLR